MQKIKSIYDAFSMQPNERYVATAEQHQNTIKYNRDREKYDCQRIVEEDREVGDTWIRVYVGYNFDNKKLFECYKMSVNVTYEPI